MIEPIEPTWDELPKPLQEIGAPLRAGILNGSIRSALLVGPPGTGKTMLARRLQRSPKLLTPGWTRIHQMAGLEIPRSVLATPFRAPHHTVSVDGMRGSGRTALPGELSLAHGGILFLDELPEFQRSVLDEVRHAARDRRVTFGGEQMLRWLPADFVLIAAMNPCPCGRTVHCSCTAAVIKRYRARATVMGAFDLTLELPSQVIAAREPRQ